MTVISSQTTFSMLWTGLPGTCIYW